METLFTSADAAKNQLNRLEWRGEDKTHPKLTRFAHLRAQGFGYALRATVDLRAGNKVKLAVHMRRPTGWVALDKQTVHNVETLIPSLGKQDLHQEVQKEMESLASTLLADAELILKMGG